MASSLAGEWAIDKMFDPSVVAKGEKNIHAGADQFYKDMGGEGLIGRHSPAKPRPVRWT